MQNRESARVMLVEEEITLEVPTLNLSIKFLDFNIMLCFQGMFSC